MRAVILAGGKGGRIQGPEAAGLPKPLVPIGGRAMLHRVMDWYFAQGVSEFVIALGHRGAEVAAAPGYDPRWDVRFVDTGPPDEVGKAGRLRRLARLLREPFFLGYCDDLSDVNLAWLAALRAARGSLVALTVARPRLPFGVVALQAVQVTRFAEKPVADLAGIADLWANLGRYAVHPDVLSMIGSDRDDFEADVLPILVAEGRACAMVHRGGWVQINTAAELGYANELHASGRLDWARTA